MGDVLDLKPLDIHRDHATCPFCDSIGSYDQMRGCIVCDGCQAEGPAASDACVEHENEAGIEEAAWAFWDERTGRGKPAESPQPKAQGDGWVSVEERMPEHSRYVLVCAQLGPDRLVVAEGQCFGAMWQLHCFGAVHQSKVTHWQSKPAPPEVP